MTLIFSLYDLSEEPYKNQKQLVWMLTCIPVRFEEKKKNDVQAQTQIKRKLTSIGARCFNEKVI